MPLLKGGSPIGQSIYMSLKARPEPGTYHWGLLLIDSETEGTYHHATNLSGGWKYEVKQAWLEDSLVAVIRVSSISGGINAAVDVVQSIPADGSPSPRTGEAPAFSCLTWFKDALVALADAGIVQLPTGIDDLVRLAVHYGSDAVQDAECGLGATIVNNPDPTILST